MRRTLAIAVLALAPGLFAEHHQHQNVSMNVDHTDEVRSCGDLKISFDDQPAVRAEEELPVANLRSLKILGQQNGGIRVEGWDQPRYALTVCKAAALDATLRQIDVRLRGDEVTTDGPDSGDWTVYLLVRTPRNANFTADTRNGPISLHEVDGTVSVKAQNGPIAIKNPHGTYDATTVNGPISLSGGSGNVKIAAKNGPIAVKLSGTHWDGSLDAETTNGPVALKIPKGFVSGVELTAKGRGPIACKAAACGTAVKAWDDEEDTRPRQLSFGTGAKNVRLTTTNGPVVVKETD